MHKHFSVFRSLSTILTNPGKKEQSDSFLISSTWGDDDSDLTLEDSSVPNGLLGWQTQTKVHWSPFVLVFVYYLEFTWEGRQRQENLVQSFTDWMELWSTCCSHSNGLYRTKPGRLCIADPNSRASCWSAPGSRLSRQWRKTSSTFSGNWTSVFAYSFSSKILLVDMVFLGLKCL